jgi:hypothetical protein
MVSAHAQKCIGAAEDIMTLVDSLAQQTLFVQSFWFTHYVCFCAILVVYIHIIQQHRQSTVPSPSAGSPADVDKLHSLFLLAETCQQHLAEATRKNCPSRRYGIILEELRCEVHRQIGSDDQSTPAKTSTWNDEKPAGQSLTPNEVHRTESLGAQSTQNMDFMPSILQPSELASFNPMEDAGILENLEGSIWWAHLDSWVGVSCFYLVCSSLMVLKALSSFPNDPSTFTF